MSRANSPSGPHLHRARGTSLLELTGAIAVTGTILLGAMSFSQTATDTTNQTASQLQGLEARGVVLGTLRDMLSRGLIRTLPVDGASLEFGQLLPLGANGAYVDASGSGIWGVMEDGQPVEGRAYVLEFVPTSEHDEASDGRDRNFDGDTEDRFLIGHIRLRFDTGEVIRDLPLTTFVDAENPAGDVDGDGTPDPIFTVNGLSLGMRVAFPGDNDWMVSLRKRFNVTATDV